MKPATVILSKFFTCLAVCCSLLLISSQASASNILTNIIPIMLPDQRVIDPMESVDMDYIKSLDVNQDGVVNLDDVDFAQQISTNSQRCSGQAGILGVVICQIHKVTARDVAYLKKQIKHIYDLNSDGYTNHKDLEIMRSVSVERQSCPANRECNFNFKKLSNTKPNAGDFRTHLEFVISSANELEKLDMNGDNRANLDDVTFLMNVAQGFGECLLGKTCDQNANGEVKAHDALILLKKIIDFYDVNSDGIVNDIDALIVLKASTGRLLESIKCRIQFCNFDNRTNESGFVVAIGDVFVIKQFVESISDIFNNGGHARSAGVSPTNPFLGLEHYDMNDDQRINNLDLEIIAANFTNEMACVPEKFCATFPNLRPSVVLSHIIHAMSFMTPIDHMDMNGDNVANMDDAKYLLKVAVGAEECMAFTQCDQNEDDEITASDALALFLRMEGAYDMNNDGTVAASDARMVLRVAVGSAKCPDTKFCNLNNSTDGKVTASDALWLLRYSAERGQLVSRRLKKPSPRYDRRDNTAYDRRDRGDDAMYSFMITQGKASKARPGVVTTLVEWTPFSNVNLYSFEGFPKGRYDVHMRVSENGVISEEKSRPANIR